MQDRNVKSSGPFKGRRVAVAIGRQDERQLPEHLVGLPGREWAVWQWAGLRGAGFPANLVLELSSPDCSEAAADSIEATRRAMRAKEELLEALKKGIDVADEERRPAFAKAIKAVKRGDAPAIECATDEMNASMQLFNESRERARESAQRYEKAYEAAALRISAAIRRIALEGRFREAVIWQNRRVLHTAIDPLLRASAENPSRSSKHRQHEELVASYLQRYCVKNDTIGFFGPVGWARVVKQGEAIEMRPGPGMLASRSVYFEGWCLDALAEVLAREDSIRTWMAPRRVPQIDLHGTMLRVPFKEPFIIPAQQAALLEACSGEGTARDIAVSLTSRGVAGFKSLEEVYKLLDNLCALGLISWSVEAPWTVNLADRGYIERNLRRSLDRIEDEGLRRYAVGALEGLEESRDKVARAAGHADALDQALADLESTFTDLTGVASTRSEGKTYAGRTLVYEDCRRDLEVEIGPELLQSLSGPLSLLLKSARWFTCRAAEAYLEAFREIYLGLARQSGDATVEAIAFWQKAQPMLLGKQSHLLDGLRREFQGRWEEVFQVESSGDWWQKKEQRYTAAGLRERVNDAFECPAPGWEMARYHSPDVIIAAPGVEAILRGQYELILGELHVGTNTLNTSFFQAQHPHPEETRKYVDADLPRPRLVPIASKKMVTSRHMPVFTSSKDYCLEFTADPTSVTRSKILPIGGLVIEETDRGLAVRTRDGRLSFDMIEAFADALSNKVSGLFKVLKPRPHTPRLTIDRMVVCRESWSLPASAMSFAFEKDEGGRFLAANDWAAGHMMPRFVFVKVPVETKPFYVDFSSPPFVQILAKMVRRTRGRGGDDELITITEMLPAVDQTWLRDGEGHSYTSELRIVAVEWPHVEIRKGDRI